MPQDLNIAIIGGGAAGFFAAITAKEENPAACVCIFEKNQKVLAKVEITGGGRCNLTNSFEDIADPKHAYPRGHKLMKRLFRLFNHKDTCRWFEENGVPLVTQSDNCVFPQSQDSRSITGALISKARQLGIRIITGHRLTAISEQEDGTLLLNFSISGSAGGNAYSRKENIPFHRVAITTGGHRHMESFYHLANMGHDIESPIPSLFTFNIDDKNLKALMGTVVENATAAIPGTKFKANGPLLITHWGMSGPAILKLSSHAARHLHEHNYNVRISVNWTNETNHAAIEGNITGIIAANPKKQLATIRPYNLPSRLWLHIIAKSGMPQDKKWAELGKKGINILIETLTNDIYRVSGRGTYKEEFVTCGGVSLGSINANTLESKVCPHMFFAGEVLDIDAITGGFNLQAAWTTGYVVGKNIVKPAPPTE